LKFLNVLGYYLFSHEKSGHVPLTPKRGRMVALLNNATHMRHVQISDQNLPVTSRDVR